MQIKWKRSLAYYDPSNMAHFSRKERGSESGIVAATNSYHTAIGFFQRFLEGDLTKIERKIVFKNIVSFNKKTDPLLMHRLFSDLGYSNNEITEFFNETTGLQGS